jgi:tetratricopeptide (TPR) repeat protein
MTRGRRRRFEDALPGDTDVDFIDILRLGTGIMTLPTILRSRAVRIGLCVGAVGAVALGGLFGFHKYQLARTADRLLVEARTAQADGRQKEAAGLFEQYFGLRPDDREPKAEYAAALDATLTSLRGRRRVFMTYEDALRNAPQRDDLRRHLVTVALEIGRLPDATEHLARLKEGGLDDGWYWLQMARLHDAQAQYAQAADACETSLRRDSSQLGALELLARIYRTRLDQAEASDRILELMVERDPKDGRAWATRARLRMEFRDPRRALEDFEQATALLPEDAGIQLDAGRCGIAVLKSGDIARDKVDPLVEKTRQRLGRAAQLSPENTDVMLTQAELESSLARPAAAIDALRNARKAAPDDERLKMRLAELLLAQSEFSEVESLIESLPDEPLTRALKTYLTGRKQMGSGDWQTARQTLDVAASEASAHPSLANQIALHQAECFRRLNQFEQEGATYRRVLRNDPRSEPARLGLAALAVRERRWNDAISEYRDMAYLPRAVEALARSILQRNQGLPQDSRDWREFDKLIANMQSDPSTKAAAAELGTAATAIRKRSTDVALPVSTALADKPIDRRGSSDDRSAPSPTIEKIRGLILSNRSSDALVLWQKSLRTTDAKQHVATTVAFIHAQLESPGSQPAVEPVEWLQRHDPDSFETARLTARWLVVANRSDEAARVLDAWATSAKGSRSGRGVGVMTLAWQLADEAERLHEPAKRTATIGLTRLGERHCREYLVEHPEHLLLAAAWLAVQDQSDQRLMFDSADWSRFETELRSAPTGAIRWVTQLSPAMVARVEATVSAAIQANLARVPLSAGLADFEALLGRYEVAEQWHRAVLRNDANHVQTLNNLAWLLALRGVSLDEARALIDRAIASGGNEARLIDTRGCVLLAKKDLAGATRDFEASLRLQPGPVTAFHLARARLAKGDAAGADAAIRMILDEGHDATDFHPLERPAFEAMERKLKR